MHAKRLPLTLQNPTGLPRARCTLSPWIQLSGHRRRVPLGECRAAPLGLEHAANGFVAEYELAGIKLDPITRKQLHAWYLSELQRGSAAGISSVSAASADAAAVATKTLPPLPQKTPQRRPRVPQITLLWNLESIKPFTQQHQQQQQPTSGGASGESLSTGAMAGSSRGSSASSRLAAAGLAGAASPDLVGALDQLCRTIQEYGNVHAVHLFLRESTLGKAPVLRQQLEQLTTWVGPPAEEARSAGGQDEGDEENMTEAARESQATHTASRTASKSPSRQTAGENVRERSPGTGMQPSSRRRSGAAAQAATLLRASPHECLLCRSAQPSRLALLRHFAAAHQGPLLAATASDLRTQIMWTRGRPVAVPVGAAGGPAMTSGAASIAAAPATVEPEAAAASELPESEQEKVVLSPQDFVHARELLMRGRHLDLLLAAAPPTVSSINPSSSGSSSNPKDVPGSNLSDSIVTSANRANSTSTILGGAAGDAAGGGCDGGRLRAVPLGPGLHLHLAPAGPGAEEVSAALLRAASELAAGQAVAAAGRTGAGRYVDKSGRQRGRGRGGEEEEEAAACLCLVGDAEGLDRALVDLQRRGLSVIAVTRTTRVAAAGAVALRWWAVQSGEYRLGNGWIK